MRLILILLSVLAYSQDCPVVPLESTASGAVPEMCRRDRISWLGALRNVENLALVSTTFQETDLRESKHRKGTDIAQEMHRKYLTDLAVKREALKKLYGCSNCAINADGLFYRLPNAKN